ncbi:MAG: sugar ABC transporter ATP-binding protein [Fimbriimonadaceae bacterium]|nr:sugar ABC transporter ATP-binding protein [Fimbriimonadaceae bacterium]
MSALRVRALAKRFGPTVALDGVDLELKPGEVHALVGENGSGKSTLMNVIAGVFAPDAGTMERNGRPHRPASPAEARDAGVAMIHQELALCPHLTVAENIGLGLEATRWGWVRRAERTRRAADALASLGHPQLDPDTPLSSLSIAMRQVVEIARAVATGCEVLLFDEPTSSLSEADAERLFGVIAGLRDEGRSVLYVSHFLEEVRRVADRITVLRDGTVAGEAGADASPESLVRLMAGREVADPYPRSPHTPGDVLLDVEALSGARAPQGATLSVRRGEVVGVAGLNGSGRTELLRSIFGLDPVRSGRVSVGEFSGGASPEARWRQGAGFLSEDRKEEGLALQMSLAENVCLTKLPPLVNPHALESETEAWLESAGVRRRNAGQAVRELSGGNQQKVALTRLFRHGVDLMLLDEPTRGIDVASKHRIYEMIDEAAVAGKAVLLTSSYLPELFGVCDRIAVMHRGTLGAARAVSEWTSESILQEATGS